MDAHREPPYSWSGPSQTAKGVADVAPYQPTAAEAVEAAQLRTGVLVLRGQPEDATRSAEEAQRAFDGASMKLHAAASRWSHLG